MSPSLRVIGKLTLCLTALFTGLTIEARPIGGQFPRQTACATCDTFNRSSACGCAHSNTEGNLKVSYRAGMMVRSAFGPTLDFSLTYNTMAADGSQSRTDTAMAYGWTHSYNILLFTQRGHMFRMDGDGRVTKYSLGAGSTFTATTGYFETLVKNANGSFTLRQKDGTTFEFALVAGTPFLVEGPVWRLMRIADRNNNVTTLTYSAGKLITVTDTYGRKISLAYLGNDLATITDPLGRITRLLYDAGGTLLTQITDPDGDSVQYHYNELAQIVQKVDKDNRVFTFDYASQELIAVRDGVGDSLHRLSNPNNWATDETVLARDLMRIYLPSTTSKTDGRGNVWRHDYDSQGYVTRIVAPDGATTRFSYDPATLQVATITDANNHITSYQYDARGNMIKRTDHLGNATSYTYEPVFSMITSMTDANGRITKYDYDARGNRMKETDPLGGVRSWTYDAHGNVTSARDKNGNLTTFDIDPADGNRIAMTEAVGTPEQRTTTYQYDAVGNLRFRIDANHHVSEYRYDGLNRLLQEVDALGNITETIYDGEGNRILVIDRNGNPTKFQYDLRQRLVKVTDALNHSEVYTYDGNSNRTSYSDRNGHPWSFNYDVQNRLVKILDPAGFVRSMGYDPVGNRTEFVDPNGHATTYRYDTLNRIIQMEDAVHSITRYQYDILGTAVCGECTGPLLGSRLVAKRTDGNGKVKYFKYDGLDRMVRIVRKEGDVADVIDPSDAVVQYRYDPNGNRIRVLDANGSVYDFRYDALDRRIEERNGEGDLTKLLFDPVGNVSQIVWPNGNTTSYSYDAVDRLTQVRDEGGIVSSYSYDSVGNRRTRHDGNGNGESYDFDPVHRLVQLTDARGRPVRFGYDFVGNLTGVIDRLGRESRYHYDALDRRIEAIDAANQRTLFTYDPAGNLVKLVDANNHPTEYFHDEVNRLIRERYPDSPPNERSMAYDAVGMLIARTDQRGITTLFDYDDLYFLRRRSYSTGASDTFSHDKSGRLLAAEHEGWLVSFEFDSADRLLRTVQNGTAIRYTHDVPGRSQSIRYPGGREIVERFDARRRLAEVRDSAGAALIAQYSYDAGNRPVARIAGNGVQASYAYNSNDWLTDLQHRRSGTLLAGFGYEYDDVGNKYFERRDHDSMSSESYEYDPLDRLVRHRLGVLSGNVVPTATKDTQYALDPLGNWLVKTVDGVAQTRTHNEANELTSIDGVALFYDANGNLTEDQTFSYRYDEENRLVEVIRNADGQQVAGYRYDALGRRVTKVSNAGGAPSEVRYFYDEARVIEEQNAAGITLASYTHGSYVDEVLSIDRGGRRYFYHHNALHSVAALSDDLGMVVERYRYDPYGRPELFDASGAALPPSPWGLPHSAIGNVYLFNGREFDEETGLYQYRARYFTTGHGRFLQRDPIAYESGLNLYAYVRGQPTYFNDPSGLGECECTPKCCEGLTDLEDTVNQWLKDSIAKRGKKEPGEAISDDLGSGVGWAEVEVKISKLGPKFSKVKTQQDTKYKYADGSDDEGVVWGHPDAVTATAKFMGMVDGNVIDPCILLCKQCVGADKIGHFLQQGHDYYNEENSKGKKAAEAWSDELERGKYGLASSGVYSRADLEANRQGGQFYKDLAANAKDWKPDICKYVSAKWCEDKDNPNSYTKGLLAKIQKAEAERAKAAEAKKEAGNPPAKKETVNPPAKK